MKKQTIRETANVPNLLPVFGWVYRYDSPRLAETIKLLDALKMCLIHHQIEYHVCHGAQLGYMLIQVSSDALDALERDETYNAIEKSLVELTDEQ